MSFIYTNVLLRFEKCQPVINKVESRISSALIAFKLRIYILDAVPFILLYTFAVLGPKTFNWWRAVTVVAWNALFFVLWWFYRVIFYLLNRVSLFVYSIYQNFFKVTHVLKKKNLKQSDNKHFWNKNIFFSLLLF